MASDQDSAARGGEADAFAFESVDVVRGETRALRGFSARVPARGITVLFGPSGSGKTTALRLCNRLELPTSGRVLFRGRDIARLDPLRLRRQVGMVFQRPTPFPGTVAENLREAAPDAGDAELAELLRRAALDPAMVGRDAQELSGGEAQRLCVARTLAARPEVLLLDEPTSALDAEAAAVLEQAVRTLADSGITVVWVGHDAAQVRRIADRVVRIDAGRAAGDSLPGEEDR